MLNNQKTRILFFIGSIKGGGKERRLIELLTYLNEQGGYELMVVVTDPEVHYPAFHRLKINYQVIQKKWRKNDLTVFFKFFKICRQFKPHLVHTWGRTQTFYSLPAIIAQRIPLVNSQITSAPPERGMLNKLIDRINFHFSKIIVSNSHAGIAAYNPPGRKVKVIYNGINLSRFNNLPRTEQVRIKYNIITPHVVVMVASFSINKDYDLFFRLAKQITGNRNDITFMALGGNNDDDSWNNTYSQMNQNPRILITGRITDVEAVVNTCTVGILFSNTSVHGEGISNSIVEYMSLAKPVVANDAGGTKEIVHHNVNGYLVTNQPDNEIAEWITSLVDDPEKCTAFGNAGRKIIEYSFTLDQMGKAFEQTYQENLPVRKLKDIPTPVIRTN